MKRRADATADYPVLYSFRRCPYAMRARLALAVSGQQCELREVILRDKPPALLEASAKGTVPVLVTPDGRVLEESLDIMLWSLERHDPEQWLAPEHGSLAAMLQLIAQCDGEFKFHLDRYKYPARYLDADAPIHRAAGALFLEKLEQDLRSGSYLFGQHAALADMAIAPFVRQFAQVESDWFGAQPWPQLKAWLAALVESRLYDAIMQKYPQWQPGTAGVIFPAA